MMTLQLPRGRRQFPSLPRLTTAISLDSATRLRQFRQEMDSTNPTTRRSKQS